jgi:hypothetical protein
MLPPVAEITSIDSKTYSSTDLAFPANPLYLVLTKNTVTPTITGTQNGSSGILSVEYAYTDKADLSLAGVSLTAPSSWNPITGSDTHFTALPSPVKFILEPGLCQLVLLTMSSYSGFGSQLRTASKPPSTPTV